MITYRKIILFFLWSLFFTDLVQLHSEEVPLLLHKFHGGAIIEGNQSEGWRVRVSKEIGNRAFFFGIDDSRFKNGHSQDFTLTLRYQDRFNVAVSLIYDSKSQEHPKKIKGFTTGSTGEWKVFEWKITDAEFSSRFENSDLAIWVEGSVDFVLGSLTARGTTDAELIIPDVFSSGMVIQQEKPVNIWGWAKRGTEVTVQLDEVSQTVPINTEFWSIIFPPQKADGKTRNIKIFANRRKIREIEEIEVGEVWIASGQSNMEMRLGSSKEKDIINDRSEDPLLRCFDVPSSQLEYTRPPLGVKWSFSDQNNESSWSAVGYHFAYQLRTALKVPVGLISCVLGSTMTESWCSPEVLNQGFPDWERSIEGFETNNPPRLQRHYPSHCYEHLLKTVMPFSVRGVIWYQGEGNAGRYQEQKRLFPAMIENWRKQWNDPKMPFYFVQLPRFQGGVWHEFRDVQRIISETISDTFMAVTIDLPRDYATERGEAESIHPLSKQLIGERLAKGAKKLIYKVEEGDYSGPIIRSAVLKDLKIELIFSFVEKKLMTSDQKPLRGFYVAGADKRFTKANAVIEDNKVSLSDFNGISPEWVRYGAEVDMGLKELDVNLINGDALPAATFTIDVKKTGEHR